MARKYKSKGMTHGLLTWIMFLFWMLSANGATGQNHTLPLIDSLDFASISPGSYMESWLKMGEDPQGNPIKIPVMMAKGEHPGLVIGIAAAIHGNELNGIAVIQQLFSNLNLKNVYGTIVGIPGLNPLSIEQHERRFPDQEDLNRGFPGKINGNTSQQFIYQIDQKILPKLDVLFDLHTASFGRTNSLYVRADLSVDTMRILAESIGADIILNNKGVPSFGQATNTETTMRARAAYHGAHAITIELGNPQVYQQEMIERGAQGIENALIRLGIKRGVILSSIPEAVICKKSYWIYVDQGGLLEVPVELVEKVEQGQVIGILKDPFGNINKTYRAPEAGIVIGKTSNPVNMSGGRIIHLGIIQDK